MRGRCRSRRGTGRRRWRASSPAAREALLVAEAAQLVAVRVGGEPLAELAPAVTPRVVHERDVAAAHHALAGAEAPAQARVDVVMARSRLARAKELRDPPQVRA